MAFSKSIKYSKEIKVRLTKERKGIRNITKRNIKLLLKKCSKRDIFISTSSFYFNFFISIY